MGSRRIRQSTHLFSTKAGDATGGGLAVIH
jgi:hypothetical protein